MRNLLTPTLLPFRFAATIFWGILALLLNVYSLQGATYN
jgi:hypothetical protein